MKISLNILVVVFIFLALWQWANGNPGYGFINILLGGGLFWLAGKVHKRGRY